MLAATGPVGQRAARLLCRLGAKVAVGSRSHDRAAALAETLRQTTGSAVTPFAASGADDLAAVLEESTIIVSAGAAGVTLLPASLWRKLPKLKALIDLNAVPPWASRGSRPPTRIPSATTSGPGARSGSAAPR